MSRSTSYRLNSDNRQNNHLPPKMHPPDPKPQKPSPTKQPKSKLSPGTKAFLRQMAENLNTHDPDKPKGRLKKP